MRFFSFSYIVADCCCSYKRLLPAAAAPTYARTVVAFLVADMEAEGKEEESHSCNGNIAVGTVLQWILQSSHYNSVFKIRNQLRLQIRYKIRLQNQKPNPSSKSETKSETKPKPKSETKPKPNQKPNPL